MAAAAVEDLVVTMITIIKIDLQNFQFLIYDIIILQNFFIFFFIFFSFFFHFMLKTPKKIS